MKKTISRMAAAVFAAAMLAACSGSDDAVNNNVTPEQPTAKGEVVLSGTIGCKDMTRSVNTDGSASWAAGEQFAIYYPTTTGHSTAIATISSLNDNGSANFQVSLYYPVAGTVNLIYPASAHDGQGSYKTDGLLSQGGTLAYINDNGLDIHTATASLTVENTNGQNVKAELNSDVQLDPQLCIYTLNLKKSATANLSATKLEISDGTNSYTVTPTGGAATNSFTVALLPATGADFTFAAKEGLVYTKLDNVTLSTCTSANVGHVFDKDGNVYAVSNGPGVIYGANFSNITLQSGKFYSQDLTLAASGGITPVAMIAYVGEEGSADSSTGTGSGHYRGLAMAMSNVSTKGVAWAPKGQGFGEECTGVYMNSAFTSHRDFADMKGIDNTRILAGKECSASHSHPAAEAAKNYSVEGFTPSDLHCSNWFLPSSGQWFKFLEACGVNLSTWTAWGYNNVSGDYAKTAGVMNNAGANYSSWMWSSSHGYANTAVQVSFDTSSGVSVRGYSKVGTFRVRPFLAF